jgi:hypothetical protein
MERWKELMAKVEREHGIVTRDDLHAGGLSPRQVARWTSDGRLVPVAHGVFRLGGVPPSHGSEVLAAIKVFPGETWASHHTAARLWGLGIVGREQRIELTRPTLLSAQRSVARIHRSTTLLPHHLTSVAGIPVTTAARTFFDLSRTTGPMRLSRAVTKATRDNLCTMGGMYRVLFDLGGRGRPGTRRMRQVLDEKGIDYVPTESELDEIGRALLMGIPSLAWQVEMSDEQGYIRRVDGLHRAARLVIEFDGAAYHDPPEQAALDRSGDARLHAVGYAVERYRWADVTRHAGRTRTRVEQLVTATNAAAAAA